MLHFNKKAFKALTFLFILSIIPSIVSAAAATYTPTPGPLVLADSLIPNPQFPTGPLLIKRGLIMNTLINDPEFQNDLEMICFFTKAPWNQLPLYQDIVESLKTSINNTTSIATIEAFEKVIMKIVHYEHYIYYKEGKYSNMFLTGINKDWFSPSAWINLSTWLPSYVSADISQLMHELKQLAQIAKRHSFALSSRLHNKADSYLYWKTRTLKTLGVLAAAGGAYYYKDNLKDAFNSAYSAGGNLANSVYSAGTGLVNSTSNLGNSIYSTGVNWANSLSNYLPSWSTNQ